MRQAKWWAACVAVLGVAGVAAADDPPPSYTKDVQPFVAAYCMSCHSDRKPRAGVAVETYADLVKPGRRGALVVPEKPDDSRLLQVLAGRGKPMPPRKSPQPKDAEIKLVKDWIAAGAKDDTPAEDKKADAKAADAPKAADKAPDARRSDRKRDDDEDDDKRPRDRKKSDDDRKKSGDKDDD